MFNYDIANLVKVSKHPGLLLFVFTSSRFSRFNCILLTQTYYKELDLFLLNVQYVIEQPVKKSEFMYLFAMRKHSAYVKEKMRPHAVHVFPFQSYAMNYATLVYFYQPLSMTSYATNYATLVFFLPATITD